MEKRKGERARRLSARLTLPEMGARPGEGEGRSCQRKDRTLVHYDAIVHCRPYFAVDKGEFLRC